MAGARHWQGKPLPAYGGAETRADDVAADSWLARHLAETSRVREAGQFTRPHDLQVNAHGHAARRRRRAGEQETGEQQETAKAKGGRVPSPGRFAAHLRLARRSPGEAGSPDPLITCSSVLHASSPFPSKPLCGLRVICGEISCLSAARAEIPSLPVTGRSKL